MNPFSNYLLEESKLNLLSDVKHSRDILLPGMASLLMKGEPALYPKHYWQIIRLQLPSYYYKQQTDEFYLACGGDILQTKQPWL
eukprot:5658817-Ditylum_brightwellii.AAC.1